MAGYLQESQKTNPEARKKAVTQHTLQAMRDKGEKISMLTCYDASFAALMDRSGVDTVLIGDSLGMVCQGHQSTLPVTIEEVAYHTASVARGNHNMLVMADLPFGTYATPTAAFDNAAVQFCPLRSPGQDRHVFRQDILYDNNRDGSGFGGIHSPANIS